MKVLVFGQTGQLATELAQFDGVTCLGRRDADLTNPRACEAVIAQADMDVVINAAAYTAVDRSEEDRDTAMIVNAMAPTAMAAAAATRGIPLVHISTDYVFDGSGTTPWKPDDATGPLGVYGSSKLGGEKGITATGGTHAILRTAWVFSAHGTNFVKTMLRLGAERDALNIVADQIGGPTPARDIAAACMRIARALTEDPTKSGTYHFSGAPDVSWANFAREIFAQSGLSVDVTDIPTTAYSTSAKRPANSRLDCRMTTATFGIARPDWRRGLAQVVADLNT
ncbi:dTDP-4-dehydrorhamnose reductase [Roseobacter litoralis]|uniref:dTDP-4-dehydrorhamnose reductase n=1 Tax=Roseobacter litoralis (strain ATCC 49566 / DSM 6996 / JCM 21268 / NBRC 15278 / OCh 149) TaxID=391595 RepID=F7ZMJ8_ROSLO|nr:dTDP-4-dehydrorhamnose reductase [Roseobacter litoralis]AEI96535.1 dTDP-4-dehydrorhamnose reductase RfbD [Roseobacter litoralis Och 149]